MGDEIKNSEQLQANIDTRETGFMEKIGKAAIFGGRAFLDMGRVFGGHFSQPSPLDQDMPSAETQRRVGISVTGITAVAATCAAVFLNQQL